MGGGGYIILKVLPIIVKPVLYNGGGGVTLREHIYLEFRIVALEPLL